MESYEIISDEFIKILESPSKLEFIAERNLLAVGTFDGDVYFYDLFEDEKNWKILYNLINLQKLMSWYIKTRF